MGEGRGLWSKEQRDSKTVIEEGILIQSSRPNNEGSHLDKAFAQLEQITRNPKSVVEKHLCLIWIKAILAPASCVSSYLCCLLLHRRDSN
mmetsp:Transcript_33984/g.82198  ORF Transcript_33984/g.82198 Transcript_33984/m.82198 type:complete len:90 (-) Transcript_33984:1080-1349(-)